MQLLMNDKKVIDEFLNYSKNVGLKYIKEVVKMSNKYKGHYVGILDSKDPKDIEEMDRALFGDEFVDKLKNELEEKKKIKK